MLLVEKMLMSGGGPTDPNFKNVTLLLHGDGTNGGQNNTFIDGSSNNFTITRNGNTTQGSFNPYGSLWSNYFDGTDDYLSIADNSALRPGAGAFTIEAWIYRNAAGADHTIFAKGGASTGVVLQVTSGNILRFTHTTTNIDSTGTIAANVWTHVAVVREGTGSNQTKLYINGVNDGQGTVSTDFTQTEEARIGTDRSAGADFAGYISNLRLVKGTAVYTGNFTPPASNLSAISNTSLLTCQSNRFKDNSSNDFTIAVNNNAKVTVFASFSPTSVYTTGQGASGYFDGTDDYLSIADNVNLRPGAGAFTIEGWIYRNASGAAHTVFAKGGASTGVVLQVTSSNTLQFTHTTTNITSTGVVNAGAWNHVAVVREGTGTNQTKLYINGVNDGQGTVSTDFTQTEEARIGTNRGATEDMNGYLCDVRLVKGTAVYTATFTPPTSPLMAITNTNLLCNFKNAAIFDSTAKNILGTVGNAQIDTGTKKFGTGSLEFDGSGDYLITTTNLDLYSFGSGEWTIEFWIYFDDVTRGQDIVGTRAEATNGAYPSMYVNSGVFRYYTGGFDRITTSVSISTWYHIAIARSGTSTKMFKDGTQVGSTYSDSTNYICARLVIGASDYFLGVDGFDGFIDDLRITKGVARYTANFTPPARAFPDK